MDSIRFDETAYQRFIPVNEDDLIADLIHYANWSDEQSAQFQQICHLLINLYHVRSHKSLQKIKRAYRPFNPDPDTLAQRPLAPAERHRLLKALIHELGQVLQRANFETLQLTELNQALNKKSPYGVEVSVNFDEFAEIAAFYRGSAVQTITQRDWRRLFLRKKTTEVKIFRRLFLLLKLKHDTTEQSNQDDVVYLKLFKNIPTSDLEMLFPNTRVRMTAFDKLKLSMTGGGGAIGSIFVTISKITAASNPYTIVVAVAGFGAVLWRQVASIFNHRTKYMATLAKNLYYYNLNNNLGSIAHLIELGEVEDCKEAILSYFFLSYQPPPKPTLASLDQTIENYLKSQYELHVDFEIEDGVGKLTKNGLVKEHTNGKLSAIDFTKALQKLNIEWNALPDEFNASQKKPASAREKM